MPASAFKEAQAYGGPDTWMVDVELWWSDHCLEDITLKAEVRSTAEGLIAEFRDLDVL